DHLFECGQPYGLEFSSASSMGVRRIEAGILDYGTDIEPNMTPYAAGLGAFVDLSKPDFIGR
ncbi:MAG: aminomethyl transferase family protein, partial [Deltaproteobacteria bacterium]|nr:aminomethyl transferase family protein [Deltaproteobacteria bacterium]